jgi:hypothetical protein
MFGRFWSRLVHEIALPTALGGREREIRLPLAPPNGTLIEIGPESPLLPLRWVLGSTPGGSKATRVKVIATRRAMMENRLGAIFKAVAIGRCTEMWPLILCVDYIDSCIKV